MRFYKTQLFALTMGSILFLIYSHYKSSSDVLLFYQCLLGSSILSLVNSSYKWLKAINCLISYGLLAYICYLSRGVFSELLVGVNSDVLVILIIFALTMPLSVIIAKWVSDTMG